MCQPALKSLFWKGTSAGASSTFSGWLHWVRLPFHLEISSAFVPVFAQVLCSEIFIPSHPSQLLAPHPIHPTYSFWAFKTVYIKKHLSQSVVPWQFVAVCGRWPLGDHLVTTWWPLDQIDPNSPHILVKTEKNHMRNIMRLSCKKCENVIVVIWPFENAHLVGSISHANHSKSNQEKKIIKTWKLLQARLTRDTNQPD